MSIISHETVERWRIEAWETARADIAAMFKEMETPAMKGLGDEARATAFKRMFLEYLTSLAYPMEFAVAYGMRHGILDPNDIGGTVQAARAWAVMVVKEMRVKCVALSNPMCGWSGTAEEVGPAAICPKCKKQAIEALPYVEDKPLVVAREMPKIVR